MTSVPYLAAIHRVLISVMNDSNPRCKRRHELSASISWLLVNCFHSEGPALAACRPQVCSMLRSHILAQTVVLGMQDRDPTGF
jgi:hypothetical protein